MFTPKIDEIRVTDRTPYSVSSVERRFTLTWDATTGAGGSGGLDFTQGNLGIIGILPAASTPKAIKFDSDQLDTGAGLTYSVGIVLPQANVTGYIANVGGGVTKLFILSSKAGQTNPNNGFAFQAPVVGNVIEALNYSGNFLQNLTISAVNADGTYTIGNNPNGVAYGSANNPITFQLWDLATNTDTVNGGGAWLTGVKVGQSAPTNALAVPETASIIQSYKYTPNLNKTQSWTEGSFPDRYIGMKITAAAVTPQIGTFGFSLMYHAA